MGDDIGEHTERLCLAIVSNDLRAVQECLNQERTDVNRRHCTKRTPLQIACVDSSPEIVQLLIDHGARIAARTPEGDTSLHLAAARGSIEIIRILCAKSDRNRNIAQENGLYVPEPLKSIKTTEAVDQGDSNPPAASAPVSLVNVKLRDANNLAPTGDYLDEDESGIDILDPDSVSWEIFCSPLHLAILHGHVDSVKELVSFGANVKKPITIYEKKVKYFGEKESPRMPCGAALPLALAFFLENPKAHEMAKTLLQLGAPIAEADLNYTTPLHYVAAMKDTIPLEIFFQADREQTLRTMDHLSLGNRMSGFGLYSPLSTAIRAGNLKPALELLDAGAKPIIEFDDYVSTIKSAYPGNSSRNIYMDFQSTTQPIMAALHKDYPAMVFNMLRKGADPSDHRHWGPHVGESVLDITRRKIREMQKYLSESQIPVESEPPALLQSQDHEYLSDLPDGSYAAWATKLVLRRARQHFQEFHDNSKTKDKENPEPEGTSEKRQEIQGRLRNFEILEQRLLTRNAQLFSQIHPPTQGTGKIQQSAATEQQKPYEPILFIDGDQSKKDGYISLFEAAWKGDIDTIRNLTHQWQSEAEKIPPLSLGESDCLGFTPLQIAILRGHWGITDEMIDILHAQHKPHRPQDWDCGDEDDEQEPPPSDEDLISSDDSEFEFDSESGEMVAKPPKSDPVKYVKLRSSPLTVAILSSCPATLFTARSQEKDKFRVWSQPDGVQIIITDFPLPESGKSILDHAVLENNVELLRFLLNMTKKIVKRDHRHRRLDSVLYPSLLLALKFGRIDCAKILIKESGAGLFEQENPWIEEEFCLDRQPKNYHKSPLLTAAMEGNLEATRWMMGPEAVESFVQFIKAHEEDGLVQKFVGSEGNIEKSVFDFLHHFDHLVIHCAINSEPCEESERLIRYLISQYPEYIERTTEEGYTPLSLAFSFRRPQYARILIDAGAKQTVKDHAGNNLLHLALVCPQWGMNEAIVCRSADLLNEMIEMLDPNLVPAMILEQNKAQCHTPLMLWIDSSRDSHSQNPIPPTFTRWLNPDCDDKLEIAEILLRRDTSVKTGLLELSDDKGNLPIHATISKHFTGLVKLILEYRPDLLCWENCSGKTAHDLAIEEWASLLFKKGGEVSPLEITAWIDRNESLVKRDPSSFATSGSPVTFSPIKSHHRSILDICRERLDQTKGERKIFTQQTATRLLIMKAGKPPYWHTGRQWLFYRDDRT